ncbi:MAG: M48 family metallopeptidase [Bacteroidales bacterium]
MSRFKHPELGTIEIKRDVRAKKFIFRYRNGVIIATVPSFVTQSEIENSVHRMKEQLLSLKKENPQRLITPQSEIKTRSTRVTIGCEVRKEFFFSHKPGEYKVCCPQETDFTSPEVQLILQKGIERLLRHEAKKYLPQRVEKLSAQSNLPYKQLKISSSKSCWGSCSSLKTINLSLNLMLLPDHLIDYVILHELCHTIEMNHGDKFWKRLNELCNGKSGELRNELKKYTTDIYK